MLRLVSMNTQQGKVEALKTMKEARSDRESAYAELRALDHTLQLSGCSLGVFFPAKDNDGELVVSRRLGKDEERHLVLARSDSPYETPGGLSVKWRRMVVKNTVTGKVRYELSEFAHGERPFLGLQCDEGAKFFSALWFLSGFCKARVARLRDPAHRAWNDWKLSMTEAGFGKLKHEGLILLTFRFAPFMSEGSFAQLKEGLYHWLQVGSPTDELFTMLYGRIAKDLNKHTYMTFGSHEHMREVFQGLASDPAFKVVLEVDGADVEGHLAFLAFLAPHHLPLRPPDGPLYASGLPCLGGWRHLCAVQVGGQAIGGQREQCQQLGGRAGPASRGRARHLQ